MNLIGYDGVSVVCAVLGGFILLFGFVSLFVKERLYLSEALVAVLVGFIVGPIGLEILVPQKWGNEEEVTKITKEFTRIVIAIQVMAAGVFLPKAYLYKEMKSLLCLIIPVMGWMWVASGFFIWLLIPGLSWLEALVIASCVTPTDPVLANSVVKGKFAEKHVPPHVRNVLSAESGANDGLGFPFLYAAVYLMTETTGAAIAKWIYFVCLYEIVLSCIIGFVVGYIARKVLYFSETRRLIDKESFLAFAIALALFLMGTVSLIGSDDILACFIAGNSVTWDDWLRKETEESHFQEVIDMLLNMAVFVYIGATMPWSSFTDSNLGLNIWRMIALGVLILVFRRLPLILVLYRWIPAIKTFREAVFSGWFGPIGVGSIYLSVVAQNAFEKDGPHHHVRKLIMPVVYFNALMSIIVHGCTIPVLKISQRINTRNLTSATFNNQVTRLPVLRHGQDLIFRAPKNEQNESNGKNASPSPVSTLTVVNDSDNVAISDSAPERPTPGTSQENRDTYESFGKDKDSSTKITIDVPDSISEEPQKSKTQQQLDRLRRPRFDSRNFSVYDEHENIIIEDEIEGMVYVIPRDPSTNFASGSKT
ncbi:hypothetical protein G9A89_020717 [Geosiphon pyriformis]|nr:hypothetical protein G9A89_020717 [Geosiphon pyriformis]